jgi:hypothetical protein
MRVKLFLIFKGGIMKKLILAMLMVVMIAMPCMAAVEAEQILPESALSLNKTLWSFGGSGMIGFYNGKVYSGDFINGWTIVPNAFYIDLMVFSIFSVGSEFQTLSGLLFPLLGFGYAILLPYPYPAPILLILVDPWTPY